MKLTDSAIAVYRPVLEAEWARPQTALSCGLSRRNNSDLRNVETSNHRPTHHIGSDIPDPSVKCRNDLSLNRSCI